MAPSLLWQILLHTLIFNLLGFPAASSGLTLAGKRPNSLRARYTRSIWSSSSDPPISSWSTFGLFYNSSYFANSTQLLTSLAAQSSSSSLTAGVPSSYVDPANTPHPWRPQTSSVVPKRNSATTTPNAPISKLGPSTPSAPGSVSANFTLTTGHPSVSNVPEVTRGFSSSSNFNYATWLSSRFPIRSSSNTSWPVNTGVLTTTTVFNGISTVVITFILSQNSADGSHGMSYSESAITSIETTNGSTIVTFLPPLTTADKSHITGASSSSSTLQSFVFTGITVSGSVVATFIPAPTFVDSLSSGSGLGSVEITSSTTVNSSTLITVLPPQTTDDGSRTGSSPTVPSDHSSTDGTTTSSASAATLYAPSARTPSPTTSTSSNSSDSSRSSQAVTNSTAGTQSSIESILSSSSSSSSSTTVAAMVITPVPIVLSEGEMSYTKDPDKTMGSHSDSLSNDQDGHQLTIHIPVLPGGCWFCPPGPPGFRLPELTLPGIYPPMKPPGPGWLTIPALTIDGDGNPTFEPEPSDDSKASTPASASASVTSGPGSVIFSSGPSSQTGSLLGSSSSGFVISYSTSFSSCITTTTDICSTLTSYGVNDSGSTTTTSVASQCSPTIDCRVLATNAATATTSSASSGCWEYNLSLDDQDFESEDEQTFQTVDTSADAHGLDHIGSCTFKRKIWKHSAQSTMTLPVTINVPTWPAVSDLATVTTATEWYAATRASATEGSCPTLTYTSFDSVQSLTASPLLTGVDGIPVTYSLDGDKPAVNVDHAYDISLIIEFLEFVMDSQSDPEAYCDSFNDFFIGGVGDTSDDNEPRLQVFFGDVAGMSPDPALIDSVLNDVKEKLLVNVDGLRGGSAGTKQVGSTNVTMSDSEKLQVLNEIGAALALINDEGTTSRFNKTNSAVWANWMAIDDLGLNPGCSAAPLPSPTSGSPGWADAYSSYMNSKLDQQNTAISKHIESIVATQGGWFTKTIDSNGNLNLAGRGLEAFKTGYPESKWTMSTHSMLIWQPQPTYTPLGTAICWSPPTIPDVSSLSAVISSERDALSSAKTQTYSEDSMTPSPFACSDGSTTGYCWDYGFSTTGIYNSSWSGSPYKTSAWLPSDGKWSTNPVTPSPSPSRGWPTASLTFTRSYPTINTRSYPASHSAQPTPWATLSAANSAFVNGSSSCSGQSSASSTLNPAFPTLPLTTDTQSGDSSSTTDGGSSSDHPYSTTGTWTSSSSDSAEALPSAHSTSPGTITTSVESAKSIVPAPWSWFTSLPESAAAKSTSLSVSSEASTTAASPTTTTASSRPSCVGAEQGLPATNFDLDSANRAIDWLCSRWVESKSTRDNFTKQWGVPYENPIAFQIVFEGDSHDTIQSAYHNTHSCEFATTLNSENAYVQFCKDNLEDILNSCDTSQNDYTWWKSGGSFSSECWAFSITRGRFEDLPEGLVHNNAEYADSTVPNSIHYRTDTTCNDFGDCPLCSVDNAERKCVSSDTDINYCLCLNPSPRPDPIATALPASSGNNPTKLTCGDGSQGKPKEALDPDTATKAIEYVCGAWFDAEGDGDARVYYAAHYGSAIENPIYLHISQEDTGGDCPDLYSQDARATAISTCRDNFEYIINTCDTSSNGFYWWKLGGTLIKNCYSWQIRREEFNLKLIEPGYHRNDAVDPDDLDSDDYRPDSSCVTRWQDCPDCPGEVWRRKCVVDEDRVESGACLCFDPKFDSQVSATSLDLKVSVPLNTSVYSNNTGVMSSHFPRARLPINSSAIRTGSEVSKAPFNASEIHAAFVITSMVKTALKVKITSGSLQCINAPQGPPRMNFELNGAKAAIAYACQKWAEGKPASTDLFNFDWSAPYEDPINLEMLFVGEQGPRSRIRRRAPDCSSVPDSHEEYEALCKVNMEYILNTCNTVRNGHYWWKSGGTYTNDCWRWSITRGEFGRLPDGYLHFDAVGADDYARAPDHLDYRPDSWCTTGDECQPSCQLPGSQRKCRGDESNGLSYCVCKI